MRNDNQKVVHVVYARVRVVYARVRVVCCSVPIAMKLLIIIAQVL